MNKVMEVVRFTVPAANQADFLAGREAAMQQIKANCPGFESAQLCHVHGETWLDICRWESMDAAEAGMAKAMQLPGVAGWFALMGEVISVDLLPIQHTVVA